MRKIKRFSLILISLFIAFALFSCASGVTAYSPSSRISIVCSETDATDADRQAYSDITSAIKAHIGDNCRNITDVLRQSNFEIVVGESNREVTRLAKPVLAPAATPDALSTNVVQVDVPRTEPVAVAIESHVIALFISMGSPFSSSIFASVAAP